MSFRKSNLPEARNFCPPCFLPFLLNKFKYITVVDPRYYYDDIDTLMLMNSYTDILYLYNVNTFAKDNNLRLVLGE